MNFSRATRHRLAAHDALSCAAQAVYYQGTVVQSKAATDRGAAGISTGEIGVGRSSLQSINKPPERLIDSPVI